LWLNGWHFGIDLVNLNGYGCVEFQRVLMAFVGWFAFLCSVLVALSDYGRLTLCASRVGIVLGIRIISGALFQVDWFIW
jgi:hypothetical protein